MNSEFFKNDRGASLAPMAGVTDAAFRALCREQGAVFCVSEMISAKALAMGDKKTARLMARGDGDGVYGVQLFGSEPEILARAAELAQKATGCDFLDVNMGCPAPKIVNTGCGSALMKDISLSAEIVRAVVSAASCPVSVKIRAGFTEVTAPEHAAACEAAGASAVIVHGRTRAQMFSGSVDMDVIKAVKAAVRVPVIGNGDVRCGEDAKNMLAAAGCDGVMVGRAAQGDPFVFSEIAASLSGRVWSPPTLEQRLSLLRRLAAGMCEEKAERFAMTEARKQVMWTLKGFDGAAAYRARAASLCSLAELDDMIADILSRPPSDAGRA